MGRRRGLLEGGGENENCPPQTRHVRPGRAPAASGPRPPWRVRGSGKAGAVAGAATAGDPRPIGGWAAGGGGLQK